MSRPGRLSPAQIQERKNTTQCRLQGCGKYGHWYSDHNVDGSLKPGVKSFDSPQPSGQGEQTAKKVTCNMINIVGNISKIHCPIGTLLDDGAPYSGIGHEEFKLIQKFIFPNWGGIFEELPESVRNRPYWQYGTGSHASKSRRIIDSVLVSALND